MKLEVMVDFVDDVLRSNCIISERHIDAMSGMFAKLGVGRLVWGCYGDGRGGYLFPDGYDVGRHKWSNYGEVYGGGRNPLAEAVQAGHRHGQEVYAYFKPYETGPGMVFPTGSPEAEKWGQVDHIGGKLAWLDPFVAENPHLRIKHKDDPVPGAAQGPIRKIKLIKKDDSPTRIKREHLEIWTSSVNYRYKKLDLDFECRETVEAAEVDVRDQNNVLVTARGDRVRVLTLSGLDIRDPYVLITTNMKNGTADFENIATDMMRAYDGHDREMIGVFATGASIYCRDRINFRDWGLMFDFGWTRHLLRLDADSSGGKDGFIAFTRGRNQYLPGALCETEPEVQEYWLAHVGEILNMGVDGIEFRVENHSTHTDYPEEYGFNPAVIERCDSTGRDVATVRGDAYTDFVREAKQLISARGKQMRVNLNVDWFSNDRPACRRLAYPANIEFQWQRWIDEGLLDQATLRAYNRREQMLADGFATEITDRCESAGIPVAFNHHIFGDGSSSLDEFERIRDDGRFASCILYESNSFTEFSGDSDCAVSLRVADDICKAANAG